MIQRLFTLLSDDWAALVAEQNPAPTLDFTLGKLELSQQMRDRTARPQPQGYLVTQEFKQGFQMTVGASDWALVEQWSSLFLALFATRQDELRQQYNRAMTTPYRAGGFVSRHGLDQLTVLEGIPDSSAERPSLHLHCQASGRLELGLQTAPPLELIRQVVITGQSAGADVVELPESRVP